MLFGADGSAEGGYALLVVGRSDAAWHPELVNHPHNVTPVASAQEDLPVFRIGKEVDENLVAAWSTRAAPGSPTATRTGSAGCHRLSIRVGADASCPVFLAITRHCALTLLSRTLLSR